jgi:hypothetical protein
LIEPSIEPAHCNIGGKSLAARERQGCAHQATPIKQRPSSNAHQAHRQILNRIISR